MKKRLYQVIIVSICILVPVFLYSQTPSVESQKKEMANTSVILVNEDEGIVIDEEQHNFGQTLVDNFIKESEFNAKTSNFADAYNALESGEAKYVVVVNRDFSKAVNSYDSTQVQGKVQYYYNHSYDTSVEGNVESENERTRIFNVLQNDLSQVYIKSIVSDVEQTKTMLKDDVESDIELAEGVRITVESNADRLERELASANQLMSNFNNQMGENISVVDGNIVVSKETETQVVNQATENETLVTSSIDFHENFKTGIEDNYASNKEAYLSYSQLLVGDEGIHPYITGVILPTYENYNQEYQNNINLLSSLINLDSQNFGSVSLDVNIVNDYSNVVSYLQGLTASYLNVETNELTTIQLFTDEEINNFIQVAYNEALPIYQANAEAYNLGSSSNLEGINSSSKAGLLSQIREVAGAQSINVATFQTLAVASGADVILTDADIYEFNAYNQLMASLGAGASIQLEVGAGHGMTTDNYAQFTTLTSIVKTAYIPYGGSYTSISGIMNGGVLNATEGIFAYLNNEYADLETERALLVDYSSELFYHALEEQVITSYKDKFFTFSSKTIPEFNASVLEFVATNKETSENLLNAYEETYGNHLVKLNTDSTLIVSNYTTSNTINSKIIELGNINLTGYDTMRENNDLVKEENTRITDHINQIKTSNGLVNEGVDQTLKDYIVSVGKLEDANDSQAEFVKDYEEVLSVANVNGVNNAKFYDYVTASIDYSKEDVGKNISLLGSYNIIFWLFLGLLFINAMYDRFKERLEMTLSRGDFRNNKLVEFMNKNLIYSAMVGLFAVAYAFALVSKYSISNSNLFIAEILVIACLISFIMKRLIAMSRFIGYGIIVFVISIMYLVLFTSNNGVVGDIISAPITALNNFLMVHIYGVPYDNIFIYTFIVYAILAVVVGVMSLGHSQLKKNKVGARHV